METQSYLSRTLAYHFFLILASCRIRQVEQPRQLEKQQRPKCSEPLLEFVCLHCSPVSFTHVVNGRILAKLQADYQNGVTKSKTDSLMIMFSLFQIMTFALHHIPYTSFPHLSFLFLASFWGSLVNDLYWELEKGIWLWEFCWWKIQQNSQSTIVS